MRFPAPVSLTLLALTLAACGGDDGADAGDGRRVVATTPQAADIARAVADADADVRGLIPAGADPHDHEIRPSDVEALAEADLIVRSGGEIDEWALEAVEASGSEAPVLDLMAEVEVDGEDPHWWQDPLNGALAAEAIAAELGTDASRYVGRLRNLDEAIAACWERVPARRRKLVTTHDSLAYYARRYGIEVIGTVIPATTTEGQASAGEVAELVARIRRAGVRTVFAESAVDRGVEQAIAREAGVELGPALHTDSLASDGPASTYAGSLAENTRALVRGLGGTGCSLPG